jgi:hypothetical protein
MMNEMNREVETLDAAENGNADDALKAALLRLLRDPQIGQTIAESLRRRQAGLNPFLLPRLGL